MAWNNNDIMGLLPFKVPNVENPALGAVGYAVTSDGAKTEAELLFAFGGVNANAKNLLSSSPIMYQTLSRIAGAMRRMIDEIEAAITLGAVKRENVDYVIKNYETVESDCLTAMQCASEGIEAFVKSLGVKNAKR
jgi:L-lactate permease